MFKNITPLFNNERNLKLHLFTNENTETESQCLTLWHNDDNSMTPSLEKA